MHSRSIATIAAALVGTAALTHAAPAPLNAREDINPIATILPTTTSTFQVNTGAINFNVSRPFITRDPANNGKDFTVLNTFDVPSEFADKKCQLVFELTDPRSSTSGTMKIQPFTSLKPATGPSARFPPGNQRDKFLGTWDLVVGGEAFFEGGGPLADTDGFFDCSQVAGQSVGREMVFVGDHDFVTWVVGVDGPKIKVFEN